jgi:hypothetical protein
MKSKPDQDVEKCRVRNGPSGSDESYGNNGQFVLSGLKGEKLFVQVSDGMGWEHVSVSVFRSRLKRCPTWEEMCYVKDLFWEDEECVVQYHPPRSDYVNCHNFVLHLFKPIGIDIPRPPSILIGPKVDRHGR